MKFMVADHDEVLFLSYCSGTPAADYQDSGYYFLNRAQPTEELLTVKTAREAYEYYHWLKGTTGPIW